MDLRSTPFPGKTQTAKPKTNRKIAEARKYDSKEPVIPSQKRVFGSSRCANVLVKPANEKPVKKPSSGIYKRQSKFSETMQSAINVAVIPATESAEEKSSDRSRAGIPMGKSFEKKSPEKIRARVPLAEATEKEFPNETEAVVPMTKASEMKSPDKPSGEILAEAAEKNSLGKTRYLTPTAEGAEEKSLNKSRNITPVTETVKEKSLDKARGVTSATEAAGNKSLDKMTKYTGKSSESSDRTRSKISRTEAAKKKSVDQTGGRTTMGEAAENKSPAKSRGGTPMTEATVKKSPEKPKPRLKKKSVYFQEKVAQNPTKNSQEEEIVAQTPVVSPCVGKPKKPATPYHSAEKCSKCRFDRLETSSYWLGQIKLAETGGKHFVSAAFFRLAFESKAEPIRNIRVEFKRYLARHQYLSAESEWRDVSISFGLLKDESNAGGVDSDPGKASTSKNTGSDFDQEQEELKEQRADQLETEEI